LAGRSWQFFARSDRNAPIENPSLYSARYAAAARRLRGQRTPAQLHARRGGTHLAQPTVSAQIRKRPKRSDSAFEQIGKQIFLTDTGLPRVRALPEIFRRWRASTTRSRTARPEAGRLRIAVTTTGEHFAPHMLAGFVLRHPDRRRCRFTIAAH
jgi:hypothetical protein